jgi:hypothetical protein
LKKISQITCPILRLAGNIPVIREQVVAQFDFEAFGTNRLEASLERV